jgi:hypothetical protein
MGTLPNTTKILAIRPRTWRTKARSNGSPLKSINMKKITDMIQGHDHHDDPPQEINGFNPFTFH